MWQYREREGPEDTRSIIEPELICTHPVGAGVTDLCFLDERRLAASLENGGVVLLQYLASTKSKVSSLSSLVLHIDDPLPNLLRS